MSKKSEVIIGLLVVVLCWGFLASQDNQRNTAVMYREMRRQQIQAQFDDTVKKLNEL